MRILPVVGVALAGLFGMSVLVKLAARHIDPPSSPPSVASAMSTAAPSVSAPPVALPEYKAPLGLGWGQSPKEVRTILSKRLTFRTEGTYEKGLLVHGKTGDTIEQTYKGQFAGLDTESIAASFSVADGLSTVVVIFPADAERPASKRWLDMVDAMRAEHGEPKQFVAPPKTQAEAVAAAAEAYPDTPNKAKISTLLGAATMSRYDELDRRIIKGEWAPSALWVFSNAAVMMMVTDAKEASGQHTLKPMWMFATLAAWKAAGASQTKDF